MFCESYSGWISNSSNYLIKKRLCASNLLVKHTFLSKFVLYFINVILSLRFLIKKFDKFSIFPFFFIKSINLKHLALKGVNNCLNTNIYSYLETSGGQSSNLYLNVVLFSTAVLILNLWQLKTVVFLHWCLICAVLFFYLKNS